MAAKTSSPPPLLETPFSSAQLEIPKEIDTPNVLQPLDFLKSVGFAEPIPDISNTNSFYYDFFRSFIMVDRIQRGRITCTVHVKPPITNFYNTLHGGGLAAIVELIAIACARTVVAEDKEIFLGEMSMSYLSGAPTNAEVQAESSVVKSGRNLTVVALEFKLKKTGKLIYTARATFYNMPVAKL